MAVMTARPVNVMAGFPRDPGAIRRTCGGEPTPSASSVPGELCSACMGELKPEQLLALVGRLHGLAGHDLRSRVVETLERTGLAGAAERRIGGYSGGMRQRLGIAQALLHRPELL